MRSFCDPVCTLDLHFSLFIPLLPTKGPEQEITFFFFLPKFRLLKR